MVLPSEQQKKADIEKFKKELDLVKYQIAIIKQELKEKAKKKKLSDEQLKIISDNLNIKIQQTKDFIRKIEKDTNELGTTKRVEGIVYWKDEIKE